MDSIKLHLFGKDKEDFEVLASLIQDAAVPISEIKFDLIKNQFFLVCSRFVWENNFNGNENKRVVTGICFENVLNVKKKNFPRSDTLQVLNLLTVKKTVLFTELIFADNILIRLEGKKITFRIDDLNKEWPTIFSPIHSIK